jgi:hypothetical protein
MKLAQSVKQTCLIWLAAVYLFYAATPAIGSDLHDCPIYQRPGQVQTAADLSHGRFHDSTQDIVSRALALIERNAREGSALDQPWYAFRRFGRNPEPIFSAREVRFYGGTEVEVLRAIASDYISIAPIRPDQDPGEIRVFAARRAENDFDLIIIGQNAREVALKTVIRLVYLSKFMDETHKRGFVGPDSFLHKVKVYLSSTPARQEFISFFDRHRIIDPDIVMIGFQGDARAVLAEGGIGEPERYSSDSLRVNWYPNVNGNKILLVSINGNRIFASRAGAVVEAMLKTFRCPPRILVFFGSAGAIESAQLLGHIVAPSVVGLDGDFYPDRSGNRLVHIIRNLAAAIVPITTAHVSVESVVTETLDWAATNSRRRIRTVDQELFHVIDAFNASPGARRIELFVGMLVTDNVPATDASSETRFQHAEDIIAQTAAVRRQFLRDVLEEAGVIPRNFPKASKNSHRN